LLPALGMASIALAFLEPDPVAECDDQRLAEIHRVLDEWVGRRAGREPSW